jgi:hypothetical protein
MALRLVLLLVLVAVVCQAQEEGGNPRQRLRALFNRRRAESAGKPGNDNVGEGAEGRSPFRLRRIRPRRPLVAEKKEDNEEEEEGQIIGVSSSVSTSSSSEVRRRPLIRTPVREEENEVSQDVVESKESGEELTSEEVLDVKEKLTAREKARLRFKKLRSGNRDEKDELLDRLLNNVNIQQTSGGRRRFRPSVDRSKLRKKTESAFNPARPASKFRLRLRRPEATTEAQTTVTEEPVTVISVSAVTSRSESEARETFAPEAREQGGEQRTTVAGRTSSLSTGVPTTERSFLALRTTQQEEERKTTLQEVVTEAATVRRTTEAATTKRPKKFDFSRSRLRPKLRTSPTTTTTEAAATTTSQPLRTTVLEERRSTFAPTTLAPTPQPFQIRVEESVFDSFPRINQGASSSADVLKKLQLIASDKKPSPPQRRPQPITLRPAFTFPKPKEIPVIIEEELELENEIIDTNPFQFVPKEVRPAFVGVTTSVKIPKKLESVVLKEVAREPIVFEVEETVRSIEQPKRPQVAISRPTSSERRPASSGRRLSSNLAQIPVRRLNPSQRRPQPPRQSLLQPAQLPAFNQIRPEPIKPIVFTPQNFNLPKFFTEPFTFQATFNQAAGPGSYAYSVGL